MSEAVDCTACAGRWPDLRYLIADLGVSVAYLHDDQFFPGWTVLVLKTHATELFELAAGDRGRLVDEVATVAHGLQLAFDAVKINYALLGNLVPHIHWHLIPRRRDDPAPLAPVWAVPHDPRLLAGADLDARIACIRTALAP